MICGIPPAANNAPDAATAAASERAVLIAVTDDTTLCDAAGVNRRIALRYLDLLGRLDIIDELPAWTSTRSSAVVGRLGRGAEYSSHNRHQTTTRTSRTVSSPGLRPGA